MPMNVLYITADQWRGEALSALGHPLVKTPHIDALATDGVLFARHYAQCSPCGPSRASMHTGLYMMNHRSLRNGTPLDARFTNIALEARKLGYQPALIGYTDTALDPRVLEAGDPALSNGGESPLPGFDPLLLMETHPVEWVDYLAGLGYPTTETGYQMYGPVDGYPVLGGFAPFDAPARYRAEHSDTAYSVDRAIAHIAENSDTAWFLHLSLMRPHQPYIAPAPYNDLYDPADVPDFHRAPSAAEEARQHPFLAFRLRRGNRNIDQIGETDQRKLRASYFGLMTEVDDNIGRLIGYLKENGLYDNTLIVFTSDHGDTLGDHWMIGKETYFDPAFFIPFIVRAPGVRWDQARGSVVDAFTESIDVMPTILDLVGGDVPLQCDGRSVMPFLDGGRPAAWRDAAHWELAFGDVGNAQPETELGLRFDQCCLAVIRDLRYKYIHFAGLPALFFDLDDDPHELHDRAADPAYASLVLDYAQRMLSWRMDHSDRRLTGTLLATTGMMELESARR